MNKLFLFKLILISFEIFTRANQIDIDKNKKLFRSLISCNFEKSRKLLKDGASTTYIYPGEFFPGGLNAFQLSNYLNCFAKRGPYYQNEYELKLQFTQNIQSLLMRYGAINDNVSAYLTSKENTPRQKELYNAIKDCHENMIKDLIINKKVNPNIRFSFNSDYRGITPYALASISQCKTKENNDDLSSIIKKKSLLKLIINLGANPNILVPLTHFNGNIIKYIPSYWYALYGNNYTSNHGRKIALFSIEIGANPNAYDNLGLTILNEINRCGGVYEDYLNLLSHDDMDVFKKNIQGKFQYSLFPTWNLSYYENKKIIDTLSHSKINYIKEEFNHSRDNPLARIIFNYLYKSKQIKNNNHSEKKLKLFIESTLKRNPHLIKKENQAGVSPLKWMMAMICPISESDSIPNFHNGFFLDSKSNFDLLQKKENTYRWFLYFLKTMDISIEELNKKDDKKANLLDYALHLCPNEVIEILSRKGAKFSISGSSFFQHFQDSRTFADANYTKNNIAFNNDYDNLIIYLNEKDILISDLSHLSSRSSRLQQLLYPNKGNSIINVAAYNLEFKSTRIKNLLDKEENKPIKWYLLSDFNIKNNKININGFFHLEYIPLFSPLSPKEVNSSSLNEQQEETARTRTLSHDFQLKKSSRNIIAEEILYASTSQRFRGNSLSTPKITHTKEQKLLVKIDLINAQGIVRKKYFKEFSSLTSNAQKIWVSPLFTCVNSYWCKWIEYKEEDGDLILKINTKKMKDEVSIELFLINYFTATEIIKKNMINQIKKNRNIEYSRVISELFFKNPESKIQDDINISIIETLLYLSSVEDINYDWDKLYKKINKIKLISNKTKVIFDITKHLIREDISTHIITKTILKDENSTHQFIIFLELFRKKFVFKDKLIHLINTVIKHFEETKNNEKIKKLKDIILMEGNHND